MNGAPLYGRNYAALTDPNLRQLAFANILMREGSSLEPARTPLAAAARALQGGIGGYFANQAETKINDREKAKQQAIANALSAGMGQTNLPGPNPDGSAGYNVPGDMNKMAAVLAGNPDTAQMALPLAVQNMQYQQGRQDKLADTANQQGFQKEMLGLQQQGQEQQQQRSQAFQMDMAKINQAFQSGQLDKQQAFAAAQAAENREQQRQLAAQARVPVGYAPADGGMQAVPGGPADPHVIAQQAAIKAQLTPPNDTQNTSATYADRMAESNKVISDLEAEGGKGWQSLFAAMPGGNVVMSPERQKFEQAKRDFVNAVLRKESGAVISPSEFENAAKQYFPVYGDTKEVIEQKRKNRETAMHGMQRSAGPQYRPPSPPSASTPPAPPNGGMKFLGFE